MVAILLKWIGLFLAFLPSSAGKGLDWITSFLLQNVFRYRRKLVKKQLYDCFPNTTAQELSHIQNRFYRHLANTLRTSIAGLHWPASKVLAGVQLENPGLLTNLLSLNKPIILIGGHQGNWELLALRLSLEWEVPIIGVYKPIKQKSIDQYLKQQRSRFGMELIPVRHTARGFLKRKNQTALFFLLGDQSPDNMKEAIWKPFLNRETAWLHGLERYSHLCNAAVVFFSCTPTKNDQFNVSFELLATEVNTMEKEKITTNFVVALEKSIQKTPWNWLWSHNRWKRKKVQ